MEQIIVMHLISAAVTTAAYTWLTHGDAGYIMAMIALYCWVLAVTAIVIDSARMRKRRNANKKRRANHD